MTGIEPELKGKIDQACRTAEEFTKLYYDSLDKMRHQMAKLYLDNGVLSWNGNGTNGSENIQKYLLTLPSSEHVICTLDALPIVDDAVSSQLTFLIQVSGTVKIQGNPSKPFQQTFMLTAPGNKWKIASDVYRLQDAIHVDPAVK